MEPRRKNNKIIVILGPTSSGKSSAAIQLAKKFNGEIISADSRQIYRRMDIGTGKITKAEQKMAKHWMIDIVNPSTKFSVAQFKKRTNKIIPDILKRGKLPIICGGTGFWISSVVDNITYPEVKPDWKLRKELGQKTALALYKILKKTDSKRAKNIDKNNKVRLARAIEICKSIGKVPENKPRETTYNFLQIGIALPREKLHKNIQQRLEKRFLIGMIKEVKNLHYKNKISWKRLEEFGLEYRWIAQFLQGKISKIEMKEKLLSEIKNYAKRQMTWFKKDGRIKWIEKYKDIEKEANLFLK